MRRSQAPLPVRIYSAAANLVAPLAYRRVAAKLEAQGTSPARLKERMGHATLPRPYGPLVWFHAASVGESLSVLRVIDEMGRTAPDLSFLITSGTATSAQILAKRVPDRTQHQFAPLDSRRAVDRFLAHWAPTAAVFVESELWPQMLRRTQAAGVPMALVNARLSDQSARNWQRFARTAQHLMSHFEIIHCQDARTAHHLSTLGLNRAEVGVNLKSLSGPLPYEAQQFAQFQGRIDGRFVWLAASTHPGEDEIVLTAHLQVLKKDPDALLIIAPRHPERAETIEALIKDAGLTSARRSKNGVVLPDIQVYLADTLGEMGLWYGLSPITCLCGSFSDVGGHNPYEPAYAGSALLHGSRYANFAPAYADLSAANASQELSDATELAQAILRFHQDAEQLKAQRHAAATFARAQEDVLQSFSQTLSKALGLG